MRAGLATVTLALVLGACTGTDDPEPAASPTPSPTADAAPITMRFGVWGTEAEVEAYESMITTFNATSDSSRVVVEPYADREALAAAVAAGKEAPDVFLVSRGDLADVVDEKRNVPVDELLDERGVEFGDNYSRSALEAFSTDAHLQCMPYGVSPMVMYYNTRLVDFEKMEQRGLRVPGGEQLRWTFDQFTDAVTFASRKRRGSKGVYVPQTLEGLAPFVYSGGGSLFDDEDEPTSLRLAGEESRAALERTLEVLRDPTLTLSTEQLRERSAVEWFKAGKLGVLAGHRDLVPELREVEGLPFDVISMPVLDSAATVGDVTGVCISSDARSVREAADFLVHAVSTDAVRQVAQAGYLAPANQTVALNDAFLQAESRPAHAAVFNAAVNAMRYRPLRTDWPALEAALAPTLAELMNVSVIDDLGEFAERADDAALRVLDPEAAEEQERERQQEDGDQDAGQRTAPDEYPLAAR